MARSTRDDNRWSRRSSQPERLVADYTPPARVPRPGPPPGGEESSPEEDEHGGNWGLQPGGAFLPEEGARRLGVFRYVETALCASMAARIATVPGLDVKIELARQVAFGAERADALWKRTALLLWPGPGTSSSTPPCELLRAPRGRGPRHGAGLLGGIGLVAASLARAYREHAGATDPITDAPTVRLLKHLAGSPALGDWAGARPPPDPPTARPSSRQGPRTALRRAEEILDHPPSPRKAKASACGPS